MQLIINYIGKSLKDQVKNNYNVDLEKIPFNIPPDTKLGDLSTALPIILAKRTGKKPEDFMIDLSKNDVIKKYEYANGYINIFINWNKVFELIKQYYPKKVYTNQNILVEHTSVNPNKPIHIGHLRNAILGDTVARILKSLGSNVMTSNYIDDTGLQMAELVYYLEEYNKLQEIDQIPKNKAASIFGNYYIEVQKELKNNESAIKKINQIYAQIEKQIQPISEKTHKIAELILNEHLDQLKFLDIHHDIFTWESELLRKKVVEKTIKLLKKKNILVYRSQGEHKNCWVLPENYEDPNGSKADKIIIKSDNTVTYTGKDIAFQLWKFNYWKTNKFNFDISINVIDDRQSYTQNVVLQAIKNLGIDKKMAHLAYQVVALSAKTYEQISGKTADSKIMMMKGREGIGFNLSDLIKITKKAVQEKNTSNTDALVKSALRAYILKYSINQMIVFDIEEALRIDGETGIYLNYTYARVCQLLNKINTTNNIDFKSENIIFNDLPTSVINLLKSLSNLPLAFDNFIENYDPQSILRQAFDICGSFNTFYDDPKIGKIKDLNPENKMQYVHILTTFKAQLGEIFDLIGIDKIEKI